MTRKFQLFAALSCLLMLLFSAPLISQTERKLSPTQLFMRLKLEPAKLLLEAIATENYEMIAKNAQEIQTLTLDEKWNVVQTMGYIRNSEDFQKSVSLIRESAKNRNLDGATLAYMQMTLSCVKCHRDLRTP